ncbi:MAG: hypothetical protein NTW19_10210 [Planctomycetota bacterium]|nr:hypothetical protein [Planctomycetota bacterium]
MNEDATDRLVEAMGQLCERLTRDAEQKGWFDNTVVELLTDIQSSSKEISRKLSSIESILSRFHSESIDSASSIADAVSTMKDGIIEKMDNIDVTTLMSIDTSLSGMDGCVATIETHVAEIRHS